MENKRGLDEREWREAPELLGGEQLRAAARSWLEARGLETSQLELRQRQKRQRPPAGKKVASPWHPQRPVRLMSLSAAAPAAPVWRREGLFWSST